jgi:farnesyl-diphosphate farnesyltransferase
VTQQTADPTGASPPIGAELAWCYDVVEDVSRTFAVTIELLEEPTARRICVGYLLCRVPDTVEDAAHIPPAEQAALLRTYRRALDPADPQGVEPFVEAVRPWLPPAEERSADWRLVARAERLVRTFESLDDRAQAVVRPPVLEMTGGMAEFVERYADDGGLRIETVDELETYCEYVAGTVGRLVTELVAPAVGDERTETLRDTARSFALLLQLVNVAKDVAVDMREENNVYVPMRWLRAEGLAPDDVDDPEQAGAVARVVERLLGHAGGYVDDAQRWLEATPETDGNTLGAWAIPFLLAVATMRELRDRPEDVVREGGVKVARAEVFALIELFRGEVDRAELGALRDRVSSEPFHQ